MNSQTTRLVTIYLGLAGLVALVFFQTAHFNFVNYDDGSYVFENANVRAGLSARGIVWAFTHIHSQNWHPVTSISHMIAVVYPKRPTKVPGGDNPLVYRTPAAAYAENGQFAEAISAAEHAKQLAQATGNSELVGKLDRCIELFRQQRTLRDL